jgi:hypothetical protein
MTIVDAALVAFVLLMICALVTADRKVADDLEQHERDCAIAPVRARARESGGRDFSPEIDRNCGSSRSA